MIRFPVLITLFSLTTVGSSLLPAQDVDLANSLYHFSLAKLHDSKRQYDEAIAEFEKALSFDPNSARLHYEFAKTLLNDRQAERAVTECQKAIELDPDSVEPYFLLGQIYRGYAESGKEGMLQQAMEAFQTVVRMDPYHAEALFYLGRLQLVEQDYPAAAQTFERFTQVRPSIARGHYFLAQALIGQDQIDQAIEVLRDVVASGNADVDNLGLLGELYEQVQDYSKALGVYQQAAETAPTLEFQFRSGLMLARLDRFKEAVPILEMVVDRAPDNIIYQVELGKALEGNHKFSEAVDVFKEVLDTAPDHAEANYYLSSSLRALGRRQEAIERVQHLIEITEDSESGYSQYRIRFKSFLGVLYQEDRQFEEAVKIFRQLALENPEDTRVKLGLIYALQDADLRDEALALSRELLEQQPQDVELTDILITHAQILSKSGQLERAVRLIDEQIAREPKQEDLYLAAAQLYSEHKAYSKGQQMVLRGLEAEPESQRMRFQLAALYERQDRIEEAEAEFRKILVDVPDHAAVLNYLGYMLADRGERLEEALSYIERALLIEPYNGAYLDSLGWVYFKLNRLKMAESKLILAAQINDSDATILEHLGDLYHKLGDLARARSYYERSVLFAEDPSERQQVESKLASLDELLSKRD